MRTSTEYVIAFHELELGNAPSYLDRAAVTDGVFGWGEELSTAQRFRAPDLAEDALVEHFALHPSPGDVRVQPIPANEAATSAVELDPTGWSLLSDRRRTLG